MPAANILRLQWALPASQPLMTNVHGRDRADTEAQLSLVRELGGNFVRLSHCPHNEHTLRMADELGLMVWSEISIVSNIDWTNPDTLAVALPV